MNAIDQPPKQYTAGPWEGESLGGEWTAGQADASKDLLNSMYGENNWQLDATTGRVLISPDHNNPTAGLAKEAADYLNPSSEQREAGRDAFEIHVNQQLQAIMERHGVREEGQNKDSDVGLFALERPRGDDKDYFDARMMTVSDDGRILQVGETISLAEMQRRGEERRAKLEGLDTYDIARYSLPVSIKHEKKDGSQPDYDTKSLIFDPYHRRYFFAEKALAAV